MDERITVLLVEDNPGDARLVQEAVVEAQERGSHCGEPRIEETDAPGLRWLTVDRLGDALQRLDEEPVDVVLLDLSLPDAQGFDTFAQAHDRAPDLPIVVLTGLDDEELALRTVQAGAQDYLVKSSMDGSQVVRAMRYALERRRALQALRDSERKFHAIFDQTFQLVGLLAPDGTLLEVNQTALDSIGARAGEVLHRPFWETPWWTRTPAAQQALQAAISRAAAGAFVRYEIDLVWPDDSVKSFDFSLKPVRDEDGHVVLLIPEGRDITERKQAEAERDRLLHQEQAARAEAEAAQERLAFLAATSSALSASVEYAPALDYVARLAVPLLADCCLIDVIEEPGVVRRLAAAHADPAREELAQQLRGQSLDLALPYGIPTVLRTGEPLFAPELQDLRQVAAVADPAHMDLLRALWPASGMVVPLVARGKTLGALTCLRSEPHHGTEADKALAETLARRIAVAIDNAQLYRTQRLVAHTLQQSLLPPRLPPILGIGLGACYRPMGEGIEVGGDFLDVFETSGSGWAIVVGDVSGKGPAAAAVTALARYTIRAIAPRVLAPSEVLARLNEAMLSQLSPETFCTIALAHLELAERCARVTLTCGGHPLPFALRRSGEVRMIGRPGMLVGVSPLLKLTDEVVDLGPGDAMIFYTDGVTEARQGGELFGEERLAAAIQTCAGLDAQRMAERIERVVGEFHGGEPRDDLAVFVLRVDPRSVKDP